jgi:hypothetical protein
MNQTIWQNRKLTLAWRRQVFVRNPHQNLGALFARVRGSTGIYLIGCAEEIVYVGQSWDLTERPIDSLGRYYHRVPDVTLPWCLALAPCHSLEMNERESTAIRAFAPKFNTSIPSMRQSKGRLPELAGYAAIFQNQSNLGSPFDPINMQCQMERAAANNSPPWRQGKQRKKTGKREVKPDFTPLSPPVWLIGDELKVAWQRIGVPLQTPLKFPINLCDDGTVVTRDGEFIGDWTVDQYDFVSFTPDGLTVASVEAPTAGLLCMQIRSWYENATGESS